MPDLTLPDSNDSNGPRSLGRRLSMPLFLVVIAAGIIYCVTHLMQDLESVQQSSILPYVLLGIALMIALGFEFVNGFHDTANAVATVIYTHSLAPNLAVVWSGAWNFLGVLVSSGAVAFGILQLLPVELILGVGTSQGFAMVFALLIAAIIWHLGARDSFIELPYADRLGDRRRTDEPDDARSVGDIGRGLGPGARSGKIA